MDDPDSQQMLPQRTRPEDPARQRFAEQHPGWEAWRSLVGGQWHARLRGALPPVLVHDNTIEGVSEQVTALESLHARRAKTGDPRA
jgi:hypothetical protein